MKLHHLQLCDAHLIRLDEANFNFLRLLDTPTVNGGILFG
jgi:hypothetical protein